MQATSFPNKKPSPLYTRKEKPKNMTAGEKERYWKSEHAKWIEGVDFVGHGAGLTGSLYFYGQEGFIKHRKAKQGRPTIEPPMIRDVEFILHHAAEKAKKKKRSLLVFKATGVGLTSFGAGYAHYIASAYAGSTSLITSSSTNAMSTFFMEKIVEPLSYFDSDIIEKHDKGAKEGKLKYENLNKSKQKCFLKINNKNFLDSSEAMSSIDARETSERPDSPYNFAGSGGNFAFVDEFAIHPKKKDVAKALISRLRDENTREMEGLLLLGGALEINDKDALDSKDVQELREIIQPENLEANSMDVLFLPFWYGFNCHLNNGHSDQKAAEEWHEKQCEKLSAIKDPAPLRNFLMTNPRTLDDVFENIRSDRFEEEVMEKIVIQTQEVKKAEVPLQECNIVVTDKYSFVKGDTTKILEHPKQGVEYIITCDGVQTSELTSSTPEGDRSKIALVVTKLHDPTTHPYMPVATFSEHPKSVERSIYKMVEMIKFFNQHLGVKKVNTEINVGFGEFFGAILDREGLGHLCAKKRDFSTQGFKETSKRFYYRDEICQNRQYNFANSFLKRHITSMQMINLLDEMLLPMTENTDLVDAWLGIFETIPEIGFNAPIKKRTMPPKEQYRMKIENGKINFVVERIGVKDEVRQIINRFTAKN